MYKEDKRYIAHFVVETNTPMAVGSGEKGLTVDRLIARDANGLPYIPGTSLAGVVRHELDNSFDDDYSNNLFGFQGDNDKGQGSRINFSSAILLANDGKTVLEGLENIDFTQDYYSYFNRLPERDHVRITSRATADTEGHGKFDEQLVHKGVRFVFEIELEGTAADNENWNHILNILHHPTFRIGAGTRKGFGQFKVIDCKTREIDLNENIEAYLAISSCLNKDTSNWDNFEIDENTDSNFHHYQVKLMPENFYLFGAGIGDEDVDMAPKKESFFVWDSGKPKLSEKQILIPATSVKGALSHRVAFWYNKNQNVTVDTNAAKYDDIDAVLLLNSLKDLWVYKQELDSLNELLTTKLDENTDHSKLNELKRELEEKKQNLYRLQSKLRALDTVKIIEESKLWDDYSKDLESQLKQFKELNPNVAELNESVKELFGFAKDSKKSYGLRGRVIISDVYLDKTKDKISEKTFDHVAIDRFTGGGIAGALYQEKAVSSTGFNLDLFVEISAFSNKDIKVAFELALDDLVNGRIQLGGNTGKGHGAFTGEYKLVNV